VVRLAVAGIAAVPAEPGVATEQDVGAAAQELEAAGHTLLAGENPHPWGETQVWLQSPEGALVAVKWAAPG
jgi:hypothetical protein